MKRKRISRNTLRFRLLRFLYDCKCWELVFKHSLLMNDQDFSSLSLVSKRFLAITNHIRSSLTIKFHNQTTSQQVLNLVRRFPNFTSLHLCGHCGYLDKLLPQIPGFTYNLTSLKLSNLRTIPVNGLFDFSLINVKALTSLTCSYTHYLTHTHMFLVTQRFPNLQLLDLNRCDDISNRGIYHVLERCLNITHLNLAGCSGVKLHRMMNFQNLKLEVLNLSFSNVDDQSLNVISNSCRWILQLLLKYCDYVTHNGVNCVLHNCTQLREINLNGVKDDDTLHFNVDSMLLLRSSLTKITLPSGLCWVR